MDCNKLREMLINTIYHTLDEDTAKEVEAHLAECPACRRQVEESRALLKGYREAHKPEPPAEGIVAALEAGRKTRAEIEEKKKTRRIVRDSSLRRIIFSPGMATAALFLIIITLLFYSGNSGQEYSRSPAKRFDESRGRASKNEILMPKPETAPRLLAEAQPVGTEAAEKPALESPVPLPPKPTEKTGTALAEAKEKPEPGKPGAWAASATPPLPVPAAAANPTPSPPAPDAAVKNRAADAITIPEPVPETKMLDTKIEMTRLAAPAERDLKIPGSAPAAPEAPALEIKTTQAEAPSTPPKKGELVGASAEVKTPTREGERPAVLQNASGIIQTGGMAGMKPPGLVARIWSEQDTFNLETPVIIHYEVKNSGKEKAILWLAGFWPNHRIEVLDQDGKPVAMTEAGKKRYAAFDPGGERKPGASLTLAPGEADTESTSFDLREFFQLDTPGTYSVRYLYQEEAPGGWRGQLWSNTLTITVTGK